MDRHTKEASRQPANGWDLGASGMERAAAAALGAGALLLIMAGWPDHEPRGMRNLGGEAQAATQIEEPAAGTAADAVYPAIKPVFSGTSANMMATPLQTASASAAATISPAVLPDYTGGLYGPPVPGTGASSAVSYEERSFSLRRGDTLVDALVREGGIARAEALAAIDGLSEYINPRRVRTDQEIRIRLATTGDVPALLSMGIRRDFRNRAVAERAEDGTFTPKLEPVPLVRLNGFAQTEISDSLYLSAQRQNVPAVVIVDLIRILSFEVDFQREIWPGDRLTLLYDREMTADGRETGAGDIRYIKLEMRGRTLEYFHHVNPETGFTEYYNRDGESARRALMKTPLDVTVVTSSYGRRKHPVLGYTRMHKGVDFRARTGTPIMAAGDGVIERSRRWGSYGNYVRIRHNGAYKTAYAHLSRYGPGIKEGRRVRQGDIIGYAGATGRVNAAHLHYEVLLNGEQVNPLTLDLPSGRTLAGEELQAFAANLALLEDDVTRLAGFHALAAGPAKQGP